MKRIFQILIGSSLLLFAACTEVERVVPADQDTFVRIERESVTPPAGIIKESSDVPSSRIITPPNLNMNEGCEQLGEVLDPISMECRYLIRHESGEMFEVHDAVATFYVLRPGDIIKFGYIELPVSSLCGVGKVIKVTCAQKIGRNMLYPDKPKGVVSDPS
jgi:hypothetical protein